MCEVDAAAVARYWPQGFCIELIGDEFAVLEPGLATFELPEESFPTFMHEVAHLVQDRGSFRGVIDFMDTWDRAAAVGQHVRASNGSISIPLFDVATGNTRLADELRWAGETAVLRNLREPRTEWANERDSWAFVRYERCDISTHLAGETLSAPQITVHFVNNVNGTHYSHVLGAWEIKEAYSVAVGLIHGGRLPALENDRFEYLVVERIISHFFGEVHPKQIIALCHWALQDLSPANTLFALLDHFESGGGLPVESEIYGVAREESLSRGYSDNCRDLIESVRLYQLRYAQFDDFVGTFFDWFMEHARRLLAIQLDPDRQFPLDTPLCRPIAAENRTEELTTLFSEVEVPVVMLPDGKFQSIGSSRSNASANAFFSVSLVDLLSRLWVGPRATWPCPLHAGCTLPIKDDSTCLTEPWKAVAHRETCAYGAAARVLHIDAELDIAVEPIN